MWIGYARVSTREQSLDSQTDALSEAGCERIYSDVASGARSERPGLAAALEVLRSGDVLVVHKLDRVGRSMQHLVELVGELQERGVGFRVLSGEIDTTSAAGRLVFHIFAALAEFERELIRERTRAGLEAARARGRKGGRPPKMTKAKVKAAMALMSDRDNVAREVAEQLGVSVSTLFRYVDGRGRPREPARKILGDELAALLEAPPPELPPEAGGAALQPELSHLEEAAPVPDPPEDVRSDAFVDWLLAVARTVPPGGWWGERKVFIHALWQAARRAGWLPGGEDTMAQLQRVLVEAHRRGALVLAGGPEPTMDPDRVQMSETPLLGEIFYFVEVPVSSGSGVDGSHA